MLKMSVTIPYQDGFLLGRSVDMKCLQVGYMLIDEEAVPQPIQVNQTEAEYSFIHSIHDVCNLLRLPLEYALKVMVGQTNNELVSLMLDRINTRNSFTLAFRALFLQQKQYLPADAVPVRGREKQPESWEALTRESIEGETTENLIAEAVSDLSMTEDTKSLREHGTHWVRAVEVGTELIVVVTICGNDEEKYKKVFDKLVSALGGNNTGSLNAEKLNALSKAADYVDGKLKKKEYDGFKLDIQYCSYTPPEKKPKSLVGMVRVLEAFTDQCLGWAQLDWHRERVEGKVGRLKCHPASDVVDESSGIVSFIKGFGSLYSNHDSSQPGQPAYPGTSPGSDGEGDSYVVLKTETNEFFNMRSTLQPFQEVESEAEMAEAATSMLTSVALLQYPQATHSLFTRLYALTHNCYEATLQMQQFLSSQASMNDAQVEEANRILKSVQSSQIAVQDLIYALNFILIPSEQAVADMLALNPLNIVGSYIKDVKSRLPPGDNLDLLIIGKTGHGKSATGNSILGVNRFEESPDEESVTQHTNVGWAEIDGRTIKVVDTPGVCDTAHSTEDDSITVGIRSISEAIANCPAGFHGLLLVIGYGTRMTLEERKAVGLLKCILGQDIIKTHTICIITFGDRFQAEMSPTGITFDQWCRTRSGFLKELFEECNYRCVLFNNKAQEMPRRKSQLIRLVNHIDKLKTNGLRYTNSLFQYAQAERSRVIEQEQVPHANEEMVRDIQLVLEHLNKMVDNTDRGEAFKNELEALKGKVDNLSNRLTEVEDGQMGTLVDTVFNLAQTIHARMDEIADREQPDSPEGSNPNPEQSGDGQRWGENSVIMRHQAEELQTYFDKEVSPKVDMVTEKVAEEVKKQADSEGSHCFPGSAKVTLADGTSLAMRDLNVGAKVLARDSSSGQLVYDTVYMFGHHEQDASASFVLVETNARSVAVTGEHYMYCVRDGQELCLPAREVQVGDFLCACDNTTPRKGEDWQITEEVTRVSLEVKEEGLYAPFTYSGCLFVDGVLMSCYVDVLKPSVCHGLLWPVRQLHRASPAMLAAVNGSSKKHPVPVWAKLMLKVL